METEGSIWIEEAGFGDKDRLRVKNGGLKEVRQGSISLRVSLDGQAMDGELYISRSKSEWHPGVVAHREGFIELVGESIKNGGVESSGDGGVDNSEGDRTIVVDKDFEADREAGITFPQDGGSQIGPADADKIAFGMGGRYVPGGRESPGGTGERCRTLERGGLNDGWDFGSSGRGGRFLSLAFAPRGISICSNSLIKFAGATMDGLGRGMGGKGNSWLRGGVTGDCWEGSTRPVRPA